VFVSVDHFLSENNNFEEEKMITVSETRGHYNLNSALTELIIQKLLFGFWKFRNPGRNTQAWTGRYAHSIIQNISHNKY